MFDTKMTRFIWLFPIFFLIHDIEEILTIEGFIKEHSNIIPVQINTFQFMFAFILLWIVALIGCYYSVNGKRFLGMSPLTLFYFLVPGIFLANGLGHVMQFVFFHSYVPGIMTTFMVIFPYCYFVLRYLFKGHWITIKQLLFYFWIGFVLQGPLALGAILIAKLLIH
ncbi:HXXEE domain-containing protein [Neobacillus sp. D3-1R]|uniref:HXXEE domain-containing protein n=1 Tax=Neobacillus sp. D3-1R TaxID=3445778 RepID=UPI003FA17815